MVNCGKPYIKRALLPQLGQPSAWALPLTGNARELTAHFEVPC